MFLQLVINAAAFYITAYLLPGITISGWGALFVVSVVWGILSVTVKPLLTILTLPITVLSLGLFTLVINAILLSITSNIVPGFHVDGFGTALIAGIIFSLLSMFLRSLTERSPKI